MFKIGLILAGVLSLAVAQPAAETEPQYRFTGQPVQIPAACTEADFQGPAAGCSRQSPCPAFLELADVEMAGSRLFVSGNFHTDARTLFSVLLSSEDGGRTWKQAAGRVPQAALENIEFYDDKHGWVAGDVLDPSPRDPFFLLTTDGGVSWRKRPVFSDSKGGFIEKFQFDSADNGYVWIDRVHGGENGMRFEFYETMTGAESWMLREVSDRQIVKKRVIRLQADPVWRLRATAEAYEVETKSSEGWQPVAAFAIDAGLCQPAERAEPAPPPPPTVEEPQEPGGVFRIPTQIPSRRPKQPPTLKK